MQVHGRASGLDKQLCTVFADGEPHVKLIFKGTGARIPPYERVSVMIQSMYVDVYVSCLLAMHIHTCTYGTEVRYNS